MADGSAKGITQDRFAGVRTAFEENLTSGEDIGAAFCATLEGETVVDLWGGGSWQHDSLVQPYSVTKPFVAVAALVRTVSMVAAGSPRAFSAASSLSLMASKSGCSSVRIQDGEVTYSEIDGGVFPQSAHFVDDGEPEFPAG